MSLVLFGTFSAKSSTLPEKKIQPVLNAVKSRFANANGVNLTEMNNMYSVDFTLYGQYVTAFYSKDGKFLSFKKNISTYNLPVILQAPVRKKYTQYWVSDLYEISGKQAVTYFVTLENANTRLTYKSLNGTWTLVSKQDKI
jgi:hypothetical protein